MIITVVGAGGKTTLIHKLKDKYRKEGKTVLVLTTTHMYIEKDTVLISSAISDDENIKIIEKKIEADGYCMAGELAEGKTDASGRAKISAVSQSLYKRISNMADVVLVEGDGARHMLIKCPGNNEPVIPENTDKVIIVMSFAAVGRKFGDVAFRMDYVSRLLGVTQSDIVTADHLNQIVQKGYIDKIKNLPFIKSSQKKAAIEVFYAGTVFESQNGSVKYIMKKVIRTPSATLTPHDNI